MGIGRLWFGAAALAALTAFGGVAFAEGIKVAVIDVNKVLNESKAGKDAKQKMEARYEELKKKIDAKNEEAKKMKEDLDKQKILLGKEKLKEREDALKAKIEELRELTQESEKEMQKRQGEMTREILKSLESLLDKYVADEKIDLLLEKSAGVIHANPSMDITARILELVNKETPVGK
ncbi:MAG: OmpH family outer membrane protein [Gemmatimonadota bacterium]